MPTPSKPQATEVQIVQAVDPAAICSAWFRAVGDSHECVYDMTVETLMLVERDKNQGLVRNIITFMGEQVATLWAVIGPQPKQPVWLSDRPNASTLAHEPEDGHG